MNRKEVKLSQFENNLSLAVCFILRPNLLPGPKIRIVCPERSPALGAQGKDLTFWGWGESGLTLATSGCLSHFNLFYSMRTSQIYWLARMG
jgi:hypothetical protein